MQDMMCIEDEIAKQSQREQRHEGLRFIIF